MSSATSAALSAVLTCFFFAGGMGMAFLTWRYRRRFALWKEMGPQGRADTILNISLVGVLLVSGYHRGIATYNFAFHHWATVTPAASTAAIYLPLHLFSMAGLLWWLCIETVGMAQGGKAWLVLMAAGATLGALIFTTFGEVRP